jgi:hypothetical protein
MSYLAATAPMPMSGGLAGNVTSTDMLLPLDSLSQYDAETFVG